MHTLINKTNIKQAVNTTLMFHYIISKNNCNHYLYTSVKHLKTLNKKIHIRKAKMYLPAKKKYLRQHNPKCL